jgi:SAM-dependent methyltransferase
MPAELGYYHVFVSSSSFYPTLYTTIDFSELEETHLNAQALELHISQALGIDVSSSMVHEYHTGAAKQGIPESKMHAVVGNLIDASLPPDPCFSAPEFYNFDIAAVGFGWHHFSDPAFAAKQLALRLKVGGTLLIIDFLPHVGAGGDHGREKADGYGEDKEVKIAARQTITHMGFAEGDIKKMFEEAGVGVDFDFVVLEKEIVFESEGQSMWRTAFMARGRKGWWRRDKRFSFLRNRNQVP